MQQVEIDEVQGQLSWLIEQALHGEEVVITQRDRPILKLVRILDRAPRRKRGSAKGKIEMALISMRRSTIFKHKWHECAYSYP